MCFVERSLSEPVRVRIRDGARSMRRTSGTRSKGSENHLRVMKRWSIEDEERKKETKRKHNPFLI